MSTNVPITDSFIIKGVWKPVTLESGLYTAQPSPYVILWFPDQKLHTLIEETKIEEEEKLFQLFSEFAEEDMKMAEVGLSEYKDILINEDKG